MGSGTRSEDVYAYRAQARAAQGITDPFQHTAQVRKGQAPAMHPSLDPKGVKMRESRDSDDHPESLAIAIAFDQTGSMGIVPRQLQTNLNQLFGLLLRRGYVEHPQVMMGAYGDALNYEQAPLQFGQFESDNRVDDNLEAIYLEGNGGGNGGETSGLALYFLARHTDIDCFNKRGQKGFAYLIGDEVAHGMVTPGEVMTYLGETIPEPISVAQLVQEVQERYELFFLLIDNSTAQSQGSLEFWRSLLGPERVSVLRNVEDVAAMIAVTIGLVLGTTDHKTIGADMIAAGFDPATSKRVATAAQNTPATKAMVKGSGASLPDLAPTNSCGARRL